MVWGIFSYQGAGRLHICQGNMNKEQYLYVLQTRVMQQMLDWFPRGDGVFMHDKAPCHTARICSNFLSTQQFSVLDWPGNSPDLNPIENLWKIIKSRLEPESVTTREEMIALVIKYWNRDAGVKETMKNLIESMPRRLQGVIKAEGGHTKY